MNSDKSKAFFFKIIDLIMANDERPALRSVIAKELLQYDIIYALDNEGLLRNLVFKGGSALRMCRNSDRFSDNLEFSGGIEFSSAELEKIMLCLQGDLTGRYGFHIDLTQPTAVDMVSKYQKTKVNNFRISIEISSDIENMPIGHINLEITATPSFTNEVLPTFENYPVIGEGRAPVLLRVETVDEILADKLVNYPMTTSSKGYDDLWDIAWLLHKGAKLDMELIKQKLSFFDISDTYPLFLSACIDKITDIVKSQEFLAHLKKNRPSRTNQLTFEKPEFLIYLVDVNTRIFNKLLEAFSADANLEQKTEYIM
jgi:predicted nucleotidyltransferase component of viral defense system